MAYQLDFLAVVKAFFVPFDLVFHAIVIGAFGIGPVVILYTDPIEDQTDGMVEWERSKQGGR